MSLVNLDTLKSSVTEGNIAQEQLEALRKLLVAVLAKGARADLNADSDEVNTIIQVVRDFTGLELDTATVRAEAIAQSRETSSRPISKLASTLSHEHKVLVVLALKEVLLADQQVISSEVDYFNVVASALRVSFADAAGLLED